MKVSTTSERLKLIMDARLLKQKDVLKLAEQYAWIYGIKLTKASLNQYISGYAEPGKERLKVLAMALGVTEAWLMGYDAPMHDPSVPPAPPKKPNFKRVKIKDLPCCQEQEDESMVMPDDCEISPLFQKILLLDEEDQGKVDGFVSGLLSSSKYQSEEKTYQVQIAARGGGLKQITLTESQVAAILNAPEVTDLGGKS